MPPEQRFIIPATATTVEEQNEYWRETMKWTDRLPFFPTQIERRRGYSAGNDYDIAWGSSLFPGTWEPLQWEADAGGSENCQIVFLKSESWTGIELSVHLQMFTNLSTTRNVAIKTRVTVSYAGFSGFGLTASTTSSNAVSSELGFKFLNSANANQHQAWSHTCLIPPHPAGWTIYTIEVDAYGVAGGVGTLRTDSNDEICIVAKEMPYWQTLEPPLS